MRETMRFKQDKKKEFGASKKKFFWHSDLVSTKNERFMTSNELNQYWINNEIWLAKLGLFFNEKKIFCQ